jgi:hypothetical protein
VDRSKDLYAHLACQGRVDADDICTCMDVEHVRKLARLKCYNRIERYVSMIDGNLATESILDTMEQTFSSGSIPMGITEHETGLSTFDAGRMQLRLSRGYLG